MSVEIIYETHSVTTDNEAGIATGWLPGRLSEQGRRLAVELGRRRRDDGLDAVLVSDLTRAVDTADLAFNGTDIPIHQDRRLRECDYGQLNGMPTARLHTERLQHLGHALARRPELPPGRRPDPRPAPRAGRRLGRHPPADHRPLREPMGPRLPPARPEPGRPRRRAVQPGRKAGTTPCPPAGPVTVPTEGDSAVAHRPLTKARKGTAEHGGKRPRRPVRRAERTAGEGRSAFWVGGSAGDGGAGQAAPMAARSGLPCSVSGTSSTGTTTSTAAADGPCSSATAAEAAVRCSSAPGDDDGDPPAGVRSGTTTA